MLVSRKRKVLAGSAVILVIGMIVGGIGILTGGLSKIVLPDFIKVMINR